VQSSLSSLSFREEAEFRAKQTNQKYDEAEQKSQAWMKAKDEAQSHKRMWHSYWQQAMVCTPLTPLLVQNPYHLV